MMPSPGYRALWVPLALSAALLPMRAGAVDSNPEAWTNRLVDGFLEAFNQDFAAGNLDAWMSHWAEDAVREGSREQWRGRDAIRGAYAAILREWERPGLVHERTRMVLGNRAAWQGYYHAHHRAAGRDVLVPIALFLEFDDAGLVRHARFYIDVRHLVEQLEGRASSP